jgi:hypothetical protein
MVTGTILPGDPPLVAIGEPLYVSRSARFVPIAHGLVLQVKNPSGQWIRQRYWQEN